LFIVSSPTSFVVGPPFMYRGGALGVRCSWSPSGDVMAISTHDPPCEQWLAGLGTGAGSFRRYEVGVGVLLLQSRLTLAPTTHPASRGSQQWWWVVVIVGGVIRW